MLKQIKKTDVCLLILCGLFLLTRPAKAIPPPDFIITALQSTLYFLGTALAFLGGIFFASRRLLALYWKKFFSGKRKVRIMVPVFLAAILVGLGIFYFHQNKNSREQAWKEGVRGEIYSTIEELDSRGKLDSEWKEYYEMVKLKAESETRENLVKSLDGKFDAYALDADEFSGMIKNQNVLVIDLRESVEWEQGKILNSTHVRDIDFISGHWKRYLPYKKDKIVLVCYSGLISGPFADFLAKQGFEDVHYLKGGIKEFADGNKNGYEGQIYPEFPSEVIKRISPDEAIELANTGFAVPIDMRPTEKLKSGVLKGTISIFYDALTTEEIEQKLNSMDRNRQYLIACDSSRNCWAASNFALKFSRSGFKSMGIADFTNVAFPHNQISEYEDASDLWGRHEEISESLDEAAAAKKVGGEGRGITADQFLELKSKGNMLVVDLRDDISWSIGGIEGSVHSRLADFIANDWKKLSLDKYDSVVFVCYGGTTGSLAADFAGRKGIGNAYFFQGGINVATKNKEIGFKGQCPLVAPKNIERLLSKDEAAKILNEGGIVLDVRPMAKFNKYHLDGAVYFFHEAMTTSEVEKTISGLDRNRQYFAVCDSELTCWDALVVGMEMEKRGFRFVGRHSLNEELSGRYADQK